MRGRYDEEVYLLTTMREREREREEREREGERKKEIERVERRMLIPSPKKHVNVKSR